MFSAVLKNIQNKQNKEHSVVMRTFIRKFLVACVFIHARKPHILFLNYSLKLEH